MYLQKYIFILIIILLGFDGCQLETPLQQDQQQYLSYARTADSHKNSNTNHIDYAEEIYSEKPLCANLERHEIERHLATKTPYRAIAYFNETPITYDGCHPTRIWSIIRHGTRNPSKNIIVLAKKVLTRLKEHILMQRHSRVCEDDLIRLRKWSFNLSTENEKYLVAEGEDELIELAERMQKRFPHLMPTQYDPSLYYFKYTATQRTLQSAQSFAAGLFGRENLRSIIYPEPLHKDPVLRFYKLCNAWITSVDKNPDTFVNALKFHVEPEMKAAISYIKSKIQIKQLSVKDAQLIYTICAFETAWQRRKAHSVWCNLFNRDTIKAFEYAQDLEYYWNDGYGYNLTSRIACPAIVDMFEHIDPITPQANATFYFTHSGTMLKILAHLGLHKDEHVLTHKDFKKPRKWRTSRIDAFASNLAFVRYDCGDSDPMILTLHQERIVHIPGCPTDSDLCSLATLRKIYKYSIENCAFHEMCELKNFDI